MSIVEENVVKDNIAEDWWNSFFKGPFGDLQVRGSGHQGTELEVDRITQCIGTSPKHILDAPCGTGRHSLELARRGHSVVGIDFNPAVLEVAQQQVERDALSAQFRLQDLRELSADAEFDTVLCLWTSIGYFNDDENERTLLNLARAVKPGGHLILDLVVVESLCVIFAERGWSWWGEGDQRIRVCEERRWDAETSRVNVTWTFIHGAREEVRETSIRTYTCHELIAILKRGGLSNFNCLGREGEPFRIGSRRLWLEAEKAAETAA